MFGYYALVRPSHRHCKQSMSMSPEKRGEGYDFILFDVQTLTEKQNEGARDRQADSKKKDTQLKLNRDSA